MILKNHNQIRRAKSDQAVVVDGVAWHGGGGGGRDVTAFRLQYHATGDNSALSSRAIKVCCNQTGTPCSNLAGHCLDKRPLWRRCDYFQSVATTILIGS